MRLNLAYTYLAMLKSTTKVPAVTYGAAPRILQTWHAKMPSQSLMLNNERDLGWPKLTEKIVDLGLLNGLLCNCFPLHLRQTSQVTTVGTD